MLYGGQWRAKKNEWENNEILMKAKGESWNDEK